jgi:dTDP-glucose pyrophosphorylase
MINILVPCAGAGSRFAQAGYKLPKPLIDVEGKAMIHRVIENVAIPKSTFWFLVRKEHWFNKDLLLHRIFNKATRFYVVIPVDKLTAGAASTTLLARDHINNDIPLVIVNSDQFVENFNMEKFLLEMRDADGGIVTFKATDPKWSFAKINDDGLITEVAEKNPISDDATVGIYYWSKGSDYVKYAEQMIKKNIRVNNEFYVCPVFNEAIQDGKIIKSYPVEKIWGWGTPEDLTAYLNRNKENNVQ